MMLDVPAEIMELSRRLDAIEGADTGECRAGTLTAAGKFTENIGPEGPEGKEGKEGPPGPEGPASVHNQDAEEQDASFNIAGNGKIGGELTVKGITELDATGSPATAVKIEPTVTNNTGQAIGVNIKPTFDGSANLPVGMQLSPQFQPSASVAEVYGATLIGSVTPPAGVKVKLARAAFYRLNVGAGEGTIDELQHLAVAASYAGALKPTTVAGLHVGNLGAAGISTLIGCDIATQTLAATSIGVRIALAGTYALQLSDTGGTAAGGITWGTDTTLYRASAKTLKTDGSLRIGEALEHQGAKLGFYGHAPAAQPAAIAAPEETLASIHTKLTEVIKALETLGLIA